MIRPGLEPGTFCVLDRCDNQLRHRTSAWLAAFRRESGTHPFVVESICSSLRGSREAAFLSTPPTSRSHPCPPLPNFVEMPGINVPPALMAEAKEAMTSMSEKILRLRSVDS